MNVVLCSAHTQHLAARGIYELADIAVHPFQMLRLYGRAGGFRVENNV